MKLYGTVTSPYVRRVRMVAHELGIDTDLIPTSTEEGQNALREVSPLWMIPAVEVDGEAIFDSAVIAQHLVRRHGPGPLIRWNEDDIHTRNLVTVVDGALDALINVFYLAKDGVTPDRASYVAKQSARAASAMTWLEDQVPDGWSDSDCAWGLPQICLYTALDWMRFRGTYDLSPHSALTRFRTAHEKRPSVAATTPPSS